MNETKENLQKENELELLHQQLLATLKSIPVATLVTKGTCITAANDAAQKLLGLQAREMKDRDVDSLLNGQKFFTKLYENHSEIYDKDMEFRIMGKKLLVGVSVTQIRSSAGPAHGMVIKMKSTKYMYRHLDTSSDNLADYTFDNIIGQSPQIQEAVRIAKIAANSDANVLLLGESGTGKELFAQAIHNHGNRKNKPFIAINLGAMPKSLIESELFGYEGGAFTGSKKEGHRGKFEQAEGGTLFLDEIGDTPMDVQVSLLRVLENKEIVRVGSNRTTKVDVRIIAATNRDVDEAIRENLFRRDLYYRLNVFTVNIPALANRPGDMLLLADYYLEKFAASLNRKKPFLSPETNAVMKAHTWPGNVRELENVMERAIHVCQGDSINIQDLPETFWKIKEEGAVTAPSSSQEGLIDRTECQLIRDNLQAAKGNVTKAAEALGLNRRSLYRRIEKYGINPHEYK